MSKLISNKDPKKIWRGQIGLTSTSSRLPSSWVTYLHRQYKSLWLLISCVDQAFFELALLVMASIKHLDYQTRARIGLVNSYRPLNISCANRLADHIRNELHYKELTITTSQFVWRPNVCAMRLGDTFLGDGFVGDNYLWASGFVITINVSNHDVQLYKQCTSLLERLGFGCGYQLVVNLQSLSVQPLGWVLLNDCWLGNAQQTQQAFYRYYI